MRFTIQNSISSDPLRGRCPAYLKNHTQINQKQGRVPMTIYCLWASSFLSPSLVLAAAPMKGVQKEWKWAIPTTPFLGPPLEGDNVINHLLCFSLLGRNSQIGSHVTRYRSDPSTLNLCHKGASTTSESGSHAPPHVPNTRQLTQHVKRLGCIVASLIFFCSIFLGKWGPGNGE